MNKLNVIVTGTDPESRMGGIGFALPGYLDAMDSVGIVYESIPTYHPTAVGGSYLWWLRAFPDLFMSIKESKKKGKRVIVYSHVGSGVSLLRECLVLMFCRFLGAKTVMQLHAMEVEAYLKHPLKRKLFELAVKPASALAVLTHWWSDLLVDSGVKKKIFIIPNPLPRQWCEINMDNKGIKDKKECFVILTMTRLEKGKGVDLILEAMPFLPEKVRLIVAGDGRELESLRKRVEALGVVNRVLFKGWVSGEEKQQLFNDADIFCLPTMYDSFGMVFLEAMSNGLPVVALSWGAISDVVKHEYTGILIKERDAKALANAIVRLMSFELKEKMSTEAKKWVLRQFNAHYVGSQLQNMFKEVAFS